MEDMNNESEANEVKEVKEYTSNDMINAIVITAMSTFAIFIMVVNGAVIWIWEDWHLQKRNY